MSGFLHKLFFGEDQPLYGFSDTRQPGPGTQEYAFRPQFFLPANSLLGYGGVAYGARQVREYQPPQVMQNLQVPNASAGASGVIAGTIYGQPLIGQDGSNATGPNSGNATGYTP